MHEPHPEIDRYKWTMHSRGYLCRDTKVDGKWVKLLQHRAVWEIHVGPIHDGFELHHLNEDKTDNRLSNLMCLTREQHVWVHSGAQLWDDGRWMVECKMCKQPKEICGDNFYVVKRCNGVDVRWMRLDYCLQCKASKPFSEMRSERRRARLRAASQPSPSTNES